MAGLLDKLAPQRQIGGDATDIAKAAIMSQNH